MGSGARSGGGGCAEHVLTTSHLDWSRSPSWGTPCPKHQSPSAQPLPLARATLLKPKLLWGVL